MRLSIVIPVYKTPENLFKACMTSVLSWEGDDIEIVLVIDSPDDSIESVVYSYACADDRVRVLRNDKNMGPSYSRNRGIDAARGNYVMMVDADDKIKPDICAKALAVCESECLAFCAVSRAYPWQKELNKAQKGTGRLFRGRLCIDSYGGILRILTNVDMSSSGIVFDKKLLDLKHLRYPEDLRQNEDFVFVTSLLATGVEAGLWDECGYDVVWHSGSLSGNTSARRFVDELCAGSRILQILKGIDLPVDIARFYAEHGYNQIFEGWRTLDSARRKELAQYNLPLGVTIGEYLERYRSILCLVARVAARLSAVAPCFLFKPLPLCNWLFRASRKAGLYYR